MPRYVRYDHTATSPTPVLGWYDTDAFHEPSMLPPAADLLEVTDAQWAAWTGNFATSWEVSNGQLVPATPPPPTHAEQSADLLAAKLASGIAITSVSLPAVNGTYALDSVSVSQIYQIGLYASQFGTFPSGDMTQSYPDIASAQHVFSVPVFIAFLRAVAPLVSTLETQAGVMAQGGTPTWPAQTATIA